MLRDAVLVCVAVFIIGVAILWKDPPDTSKEADLREWDRQYGNNWDEITGGWT